MNTIGLKMIVLLSVFGFVLSACTTQTPSAPTQTHPESGYEDGFGGNGGHNHQPKND
ncbi:TPA: hypothetical protein ACWCZX_002633 [Legionella pneumophila]